MQCYIKQKLRKERNNRVYMQINCNKFDLLNTHITHNQKQKNNRVREGRNIK